MKAFSGGTTYSLGSMCHGLFPSLILMEISNPFGSGELCPPRTQDLKYNAEVALLSLLLNMDFFLPLLESSFPAAGQQAARSSND